jgi:hypothetical protein
MSLALDEEVEEAAPVTSSAAWCAQPGSQQLFFSVPYEVFEVLLEGTRGGGKTDCLIMDFCREVGQGFGAEWCGYLFKRHNPELQDVIQKCRKWLPRMFPGVQFRQTPYFTIVFPGGEWLMLRHMSDEDDYWDVHGSSVAWIGWEELSNWATPVLFLRCMSLIRSSHPQVARRKRARATTNPGGPGHNWIRARYKLPGKRNQIIEGSDVELARKWMTDDDLKLDTIKAKRLRMAIFSDIRENKIFLDADPTYLDGLRQDADTEAQYRAWIHGDWNIVSGGMFDDVWNQRTHWIQPFDIPVGWKINRSFDWGEAKPFSVGWWAQSDGSDVQTKTGKWVSTVRGDLFRIGEWYGWNGQPNVGSKLTSTEIAAGMVERELAMRIYRRCVAGPADTGIFSSFDGKASIAAEMAKQVRRPNGKPYRGITWTEARKGPNSRKPGWTLMRRTLKNAIRTKGVPRERAGLFIFDTCEHFLRTVPVLPRDQKDPDDVDTDAEDHIADDARYRVIEIGHGLSLGTTVGDST